MFTEDLNLCRYLAALLYRGALSNVIFGNSFFLLVGRATIVPLVTRSHGNVLLDSDEPAGAADISDVPAAAMLPSAQPVEAPAPRPRSGIAGLPARGPWPDTVATGSSRSSVVHTAPGYLCPCRHSQGVKPLWFGRTLTQYLFTLSRTKRRAELLAPCWYFFPCLTAGVVRAGAPVLVRLRPLPFLRSSVVEEDK